MSQLSNIRSTLQSMGFGPTLTSLSEEYKVPEDVVSLAVLVKAMQLASESKPLDPESVTVGSQNSDKVREIPSVATLSRQPNQSTVDSLLEPSRGVRFDPRLSITDFASLKPANALETIHFLLSTNASSKKQISAIHSYLFENEGAFEAFLTLNGSSADAKNKQFELFLKVMDTDLLNEHNTTWLGQVVNFAFSPERMEWIQIQNEEVDPDLNSTMLLYEARHRSETLSKDISTFQSTSPGNFQKWLTLRMSGSRTISTQSLVTHKATSNWLITEEKTRVKAEEQGQLGQRMGFGTVRILHRTLTTGEEENAGQIRKKVVRSSMADELYPVPDKVEEMTVGYERWLNQQIELCQDGKKSVILTAAQAYQRLVSIHPFDGGNGRISRHMMDYVLERFGLPPAALGSSVDDATFGLKVKSPLTQQAFVLKVFEGVKRSYDMIHRG